MRSLGEPATVRTGQIPQKEKGPGEPGPFCQIL
jgi:hypothetical protein